MIMKTVLSPSRSIVCTVLGLMEPPSLAIGMIVLFLFLPLTSSAIVSEGGIESGFAKSAIVLGVKVGEAIWGS